MEADQAGSLGLGPGLGLGLQEPSGRKCCCPEAAVDSNGDSSVGFLFTNHTGSKFRSLRLTQAPVAPSCSSLTLDYSIFLTTVPGSLH